MALKAEVDQLRALLPTQAHTMVDVEHQFANLWFAAHEKNWPLATFYLNETRNRVAWTLRIRPVRKLANGADIALAPLVQSFEEAGLKPLRAAVEKQDRKAFEAAYRTTLGLCHGCHVAVEKPALEPEVPEKPGALLIRMKPHHADQTCTQWRHSGRHQGCIDAIHGLVTSLFKAFDHHRERQREQQVHDEENPRNLPRLPARDTPDVIGGHRAETHEIGEQDRAQPRRLLMA